jgi:hypothetical protein
LISEYFPKICLGNSGFIKNLTIITGTLLEEARKFMIISRSVILRMRNASDTSCRENQNLFSHFSENRAIYDIMWKNMIWTGHR